MLMVCNLNLGTKLSRVLDHILKVLSVIASLFFVNMELGQSGR
nr:MAG TPA: hypothetical protein [Siphoviridae sp. cta6m1]